MALDAADFTISSVTVGVVVVLSPRAGLPAGRDLVSAIHIYTPVAGHGRAWQVGRNMIVRIQ
jgi:hypothetical protein